MRQTKQKEMLEEELKKKTTFFTAEDFYQDIQKKKGKIGIATIYRFLNEKVKNHTVHSYSCNRRTLFSREKKTHSHFICEICKEQKHVNIKNIDFLKNEISGEICHFQLDVSGICEKCLKNEKRF
ncbi:hypothetical protein EXS74_01895 [Candidatus Woesearchaeota archaeon]|nr:hypothetical protein [Candidatus Woesearchaeota archaeon]